MSDTWIDLAATTKKLDEFFQSRSKKLTRFGSTLNQVFEAFVYTEVLGWYRNRKWRVTLMHPDATQQPLRSASGSNSSGTSLSLKFSTRGAPDHYTYAVCTRKGTRIQVRHQLRVDTAHYRRKKAKGSPDPWCNVCLDVAVIEDSNLAKFKSDWSIPSSKLLTFGEAKHMSAYAELVAGFVGLVHEMQPTRLKRTRLGTWAAGDHPAPFLYVSGALYKTAEGLAHTIRRRKYDVDIYTRVEGLTGQFALPTKPAPKKSKDGEKHGPRSSTQSKGLVLQQVARADEDSGEEVEEPADDFFDDDVPF